MERPSMEVVKEPKRRATTADNDCGILAQQTEHTEKTSQRQLWRSVQRGQPANRTR